MVWDNKQINSWFNTKFDGKNLLPSWQFREFTHPLHYGQSPITHMSIILYALKFLGK